MLEPLLKVGGYMSYDWSLVKTWDQFSGLQYLNRSSVGMLGGTMQSVSVMDLETGQYGKSYKSNPMEKILKVDSTRSNIFCFTASDSPTLYKLDPQTMQSVGSYKVPGLVDFAADEDHLYTLLCAESSTTIQELNPSTLTYIATAQMTGGVFGRIVAKNGKVGAFSTDGKHMNLASFSSDLAKAHGHATLKEYIPTLFQADSKGWLYYGLDSRNGLHSYCLSPLRQQGSWGHIPASVALHVQGNTLFVSQTNGPCSVFRNDVMMTEVGILPSAEDTSAFGSLQENQLLCATGNGLNIYSKGDNE